MLKNLHPCLSPDILHTLASMGHGDEVVLVDANFSTHCHEGHGPRVIRAGGYEIATVLEAVLRLLPLDRLAANDAAFVIQPPGDGLSSPSQFILYQDIIHREEGGDWIHVVPIEKPQFLDKCRKAFAIIVTSDGLLNASILLRKGALLITPGQSFTQNDRPDVWTTPSLVSRTSSTSSTPAQVSSQPKILSLGQKRASSHHGVEHLGATRTFE